jgi:hypothetical protein
MTQCSAIPGFMPGLLGDIARRDGSFLEKPADAGGTGPIFR